jgi:hypothetical protein
MKKDARFYFANLGADVARCVKALEIGNEGRYEQSLARARKTLGFLRVADRPEVYEEGLLLVYGLTCARKDGATAAFADQLDRLNSSFAAV